MGRKKVDIKIRVLIEHCIASRQRSLFCILGQKAPTQVVVLHHMLHKARSGTDTQKRSVLWCFKKDNGYSFICHKKQRLLKKKYSGNYSACEEDSFDFFLASSNIKFCHYNDTTSVLGQTFGMLVIQDFEAVTPNILSRIVECIEGGGVIILLLSTTQSLQEIVSLKMDAHSRFITSAHSSVDPVFNNRFMLSLADCENSMILDDNLRILLCSTRSDAISSPNSLVKKKLGEEMCEETDSTDILNRISSLCCTADQTKALETFISTLRGKCTNCVVSLISARGRGKSATLGLSISCALNLKYSNIYVTSPQLENVQTVFLFVMKGMNTLDYKNGKDYSISYCTVENKKLISGISIFHDHKQVVKYFNPIESLKVGISDIVVIDEAAAIPLPVVKSWLGQSNIIFMASTVNGYEGTGRSLSLKLMSQLRELSLQNTHSANQNHSSDHDKSFVLKEIELNEAIRYSDGDKVERWLNNLFCLSSETTFVNSDMPDPESCQLFYVNRKILFSYQNVAEKFLQQLVALFVSSHYKNSPNDLLMMADAPSHHIFCLLPPVNKQARCLPNALCVIQVALEGQISKDCVIQELSHGKRASGDLIPWIISQQFQDDNFPVLSGARIVRIATHPNYQRMGYGQRALQLLFSYYTKNFKSHSPCRDVKKESSALLLNLDELEPEQLDYIGVSYGLTLELLRFWKKLEFVPLYVRQTASETTGEHSCIMIKTFKDASWLPEYLSDFVQRFTILLTSAFQNLPAVVALEILRCKRNNLQEALDSAAVLNTQSLITERSMKRLEAYCNHLVDYHLIMDLVPVLARFYFMNYFRDYFLSSIQETILLCMGLQNKLVEKTSQELNMETSQVMGMFMKTVKKMLNRLAHIPKSDRQNKVLKESGQSKVETQNSLVKDLCFKRKQENPNHREKKKQRPHKTPS